MPLVPKPDSRGFQGFVYLCWFQKHAANGERVVRTVGQAENDTGLRLGTSFAYLAQLKAAEQLGQKRSSSSGYRLVSNISGLDAFLGQLGCHQVAKTLGIEEGTVLAWNVGSGQVVTTTATTTRKSHRAEAELVPKAAAPHAAAPAITLDQIQAAVANVVSPLVQEIASLKTEQLALRNQLNVLATKPQASGGSAGLESALVGMISLLRDLPEKLIGDQTAKLENLLSESGKMTGRGLRNLRETLEFQNRETTAVLSKVADSLTKLLASKDATLMSLANSLNAALSLVPEEELSTPSARPVLPVPVTAEATVPAPTNGNGSGN